MSLPYKERMDRTELGWAAGFFDAEGWAAAVKSRRGTRPVAQINQADASGVPEVLTRFQAAVGVGRIGGPQRTPGKVDLYHWVASSSGDVRRTFEVLSPWLGPVKTRQFVHAVGPVATLDPASHAEMLAWAAGLFDGDGSTCFAKHKSHAGYVRAEMAITQACRSGMPVILVRFRDIVGAGRVGGPFGGNARWQPVYRWKAHRLAEVERIVELLWPWLGLVKREQASKVIAAVAAQPVLPRGNPALGRNKTHCVHGHEFTAVRKRPYLQRKSASADHRARGHRGCLLCLREYARRKRVEKKAGGSEPTPIREPAEPYLLK